MNKLRRYAYLCGFALFLGCIVVFFAQQLLLKTSFNIDTDLKDLAPNISQNTEIQQAIDALAGHIEKKLIIMLSSDDLDELDEAIEVMPEWLSHSPMLQINQQEDDHFEKLVNGLAPYRFNFLTPSQQGLLEQSDESLIAHAKNELTLFNTPRLLPFKSDPLAWFSSAVLHQFDQLSNRQNDEGIYQQTIDGKIHYHAPFFITIQGEALSLDTQKQLSLFFNNLEQQIHTQYPSITINKSGIFFFAADAASTSEKDIKRISMWSMLGIALLLGVTFRSLFALSLPAISIGFGVLSATVVTHNIYGSLHVLTIVFGASLIGIVVDYSLHYLYYRTHTATSKTENSLHKALGLSLLTSVIGYSALGFSELASLQKMATFSVIGLIASWLCVVVFAPYLTKRKIKTSQLFIPALLKRLQQFTNLTIGRFSGSLSTTIILIFLILLGLGLIRPNDSPHVFFTPSIALLEQEKQISAVSNDYEPGRYFIFQATTVTELYEQIDQLKKTAGKRLEGNILTIQHWLPSPIEQQHNYSRQAKIYKAQGVAAQLIEQLGASPKLATELTQEYSSSQHIIEPNELLTLLADTTPPLWLEQDNKITSFGLIKKGTDTEGLDELASTLASTHYIDTLGLSTQALKQQRHSASKVLILAYLFVGLVLLIRYRSVYSLKLLLVPICATLGTLIVLSAAGQAITLFHIMALFLILGLGMDYVIFCTELTSQRSMALQAILLSALTSLLSFGLLSLSSMPVVNAFGTTILIGNGLNLLGCSLLFSKKHPPTFQTK